jgi:putative radical SAM enzyme (TIGR03279 family)
MMNNRFAGKSLDYLKRFADNGIKMNCQIVLCKGLNDGDELINTMHDLATLYPAVSSVSIVPAGLTKHREGLYPLEPFTPEETRKIISKVQNFALLCKKEYGSSIFYCGDEMYLKAGMDIPSADYYEDFSQIENGVGMIASMLEEFDFAFDDLDETPFLPREVSVATGNAAYPFIKSLTERLENRFSGLKIYVYNIDNDFFGHNITVAGLITGTVLINQLKNQPLGEKLFLPRTMLESEGKLFLDSIELSEAKKELNIEIETICNDGEEFLYKLLGIKQHKQ